MDVAVAAQIQERDLGADLAGGVLSLFHPLLGCAGAGGFAARGDQDLRLVSAANLLNQDRRAAEFNVVGTGAHGQDLHAES